MTLYELQFPNPFHSPVCFHLSGMEKIGWTISLSLLLCSKKMSTFVTEIM